MVGVGGQFYQTDTRFAPINFASQLLVELLGKVWFGGQLLAAERSSTAHPVISWYEGMRAWQDSHADEAGRVTGIPSGPAKAWYLLAYDAWVLEHHFLLKPLLGRLRDQKAFQGARYELTTYALFIRGGFTPERDPETDNSSKHVEFIAQHRTSGDRVAVEAKSRHRPGVLGQPGAAASDPEPTITGRLRDALTQRRPMPYVICIELNLPPAEDAQQAQKKLDAAHAEVELVSQEYTQNGEKFPATLVVITNYPDHYGDPSQPAPDHYQCVVKVREPEHPFSHPETQGQIVKALNAYGNLPRSWEDFNH
jgi:hypothetical protein